MLRHKTGARHPRLRELKRFWRDNTTRPATVRRPAETGSTNHATDRDDRSLTDRRDQQQFEHTAFAFAAETSRRANRHAEHQQPGHEILRNSCALEKTWIGQHRAIDGHNYREPAPGNQSAAPGPLFEPANWVGLQLAFHPATEKRNPHHWRAKGLLQPNLLT